MKGGETSVSAATVDRKSRPPIAKRVVSTASGTPSSVAPTMPPTPTIRVFTSAVWKKGWVRTRT
jgi:hypothetical protein